MTYKNLKRCSRRSAFQPPVNPVWETQRSLPAGHYEIKAAAEEQKAEYAACTAQESAWRRKHLDTFLGPAAVRRLAAYLCAGLGVRAVKVAFGDMGAWGGLYGVGMVHLPSRGTEAFVVAHEIAHHVVQVEGLRGVHDRDFLWVEAMLLEGIATWLRRT